VNINVQNFVTLGLDFLLYHLR